MCGNQTDNQTDNQTNNQTDNQTNHNQRIIRIIRMIRIPPYIPPRGDGADDPEGMKFGT